MSEPPGFTTKTGFVEGAIREAIFSGQLKPGEWLRAEEWANRLGVSPTPVREALGKLEAAGLVKVFPHRGAQVARFDLHEFVEVYRIRAVLEGLATRLAIQHAGESGLEHSLERTYVRMVAAADAGDAGEMRRINRDFHMILYAAAQSPRLEAIITNLWATFPWDTLSLVVDRTKVACAEHGEMLQAVRDRDADRAAILMSRHIESAATALLESVQSADRTGTNGLPDWAVDRGSAMKPMHEKAR